MSDDDNLPHEKPFSIEIARQGRAICKKCKQKCVQGDLRIAKLTPNPLGTAKMKTWHHVKCIFEVFSKQRQTTKRIEGPHDIEGWEILDNDDKVDILKKIQECNKAFEAKMTKSSKKSKRVDSRGKPPPLPPNNVSTVDDSSNMSSDSLAKDGVHKENYFRVFRKIVAKVSNVSSSNQKIAVFRETFAKSSDGASFKGDMMLWCKLLLPAVIKRVFHLQTKQLVKIFSRIFQITDEGIMNNLDQGDVGQTIQHFFEQNKDCKPAKKSTLTIHEVDEFLETLTTLSKEEDYYNHFKTFMKKCTSNDLKVVIRLIKHDLRMNAGAKHVFEGLHPNAYLIFQSCRDIKTVINSCWGGSPKKENPLSEIKGTPKVVIKRSSKRKTSIFETKSAKKIKKENIKETVKSEPKIEKDTVKNLVQTEVDVEVPEKRKSIPTYFKDIKLYLEEGVAKVHAEWIRHFIAYGGTVLKPEEHEEATHVLHLKDTISEPVVQCTNSARHIIVEWIKDAVAKESLQDYRPYTVRWKPRHKE